MHSVALLVAGVVLGGIAAAVLLRAKAPRGPERAPAKPRARSISPVSEFLGHEGLDIRVFTDTRFASLRDELLGDAMRASGADAAATWHVAGDRVTPDLRVGDAALVQHHAAALTPLLVWAAQEGATHFGPDGDAPHAVVAPILARDGRGTGALALLFRGAIVGDRAELKDAVRRWAERVSVVTELVANHEELARSNRRTRTLLRTAESWDVDERADDLGVRLCASIEQLTGADGAALVRWDDRSRSGQVVVADGSCARYAGSAVDEDSLAGGACRENIPQLWHEVSGRGEGPEALFSRALPIQPGCVLVQPLRRRGGVIGAVVATHSTPGALGPAELRALALFDAVASFRLASAWRLEELSKRVVIDGLTGLRNRDGFESEMRDALGEQMRFGWEVTLVLLDVDHFKVVNDTHGHEVGDEVLRVVAGILEDGVRVTDVCARVGGDEFALILKDTGSDGAHELAERLRSAIAGARIQAGALEVRVTASLGVVTYPTEVADWDSLYRRADAAMYEAKGAGRNEVRRNSA